MDQTTDVAAKPSDGLRLAGRATPGVLPVARARWVPVVVALAALLAVYAPVIAEMAVEWARFPSLSHGFAVPLVSVYLISRRRGLIAGEPLGSTRAGLAVLVAALGLLLAGVLTSESFVSRLSLPLALLGMTLYLTGPRVTGHVWPAIAYLVFMIPFPHLPLREVTFQSRLLEAGVTARTLQWLGVPVLQHGVLLRLPSMTLEVADDCSAVMAIPALVALGVAYASLQPGAAWIRGTLALSAAPLGLVANLVRLVLTVLAAYYVGPVTLTSPLHRFGGTTVFVAAVVLLAGMGQVLLRLAGTERR